MFLTPLQKHILNKKPEEYREKRIINKIQENQSRRIGGLIWASHRHNTSPWNKSKHRKHTKIAAVKPVEHGDYYNKEDW